MKKVLINLAISTMLAACGGNEAKDANTPPEIMADTTSSYDNTLSTDTGAAVITEQAPVETKKSTTTTTHKSSTPVTKATSHTKTEPVSSTTTSTSTTTAPATVPVEEHKKGWSNAAKDAVIGGGAGAIGGAIIGKKKVKSAAIGAAVGAAGGYIIGRKKDKQDTLR